MYERDVFIAGSGKKKVSSVSIATHFFFLYYFLFIYFLFILSGVSGLYAAIVLSKIGLSVHIADTGKGYIYKRRMCQN